MTPQEKVEELQKFRNSKVWSVLRDEMEEAILTSAFQLADNKPLSIEELHFKRGALYAAKQFLNLPEQLVMKAQNEVALSVEQEFNS